MKNSSLVKAVLIFTTTLILLARGDALARTGEKQALVAETPAFTFHSNFRLNLHDFLVMLVQSKNPPELNESAFSELPHEHQRGWQKAVEYYRENMSTRSTLFDTLMAAIRFDLTGIESEIIRLAPELDFVRKILESASPAYRAVFWQEHDERNKKWIAAVLPLLQTYEDSIKLRLVRHYQMPWPEDRIPVDVVSYVSSRGANTSDVPMHVMMSSVNEEYQGLFALEMIFHEASHTIVSATGGKLGQYLKEISDQYGKQPPRRLWHAILFYTAGKTTQGVLAENGITDYIPYMIAHDVFLRYLGPMEPHWPDYMANRIDMKTAVLGIVAEIYGE